MTVSTLSISKATSGNGSTTSFPYDYKILEATDLQVIIRSATGAETIKATSTYTVTGVGADSGTIVFNNSNIPVSGETVVVRRNVPQTQAIDYIANDPFPAETHEEGLDRATMVAQQVSNDADRSIKISKTNTIGSTEFTVGATDRANKVLSFNASGELAVAQELGTFKGNSATTTTAAYVVRDIVKGTTTAQLNNIYICIQASPIGTALTNTAYWTLIVDAVSAAASASTASTKAGEAAASASTASTKAGEASTSATAAANSFDSFDDRYLGAKSSDPSTDNDGNSLITGALYFNSSSNAMKVYTGSAWQTVTVSSANQTNINTVAGISSQVTAVANDATDIGTVAGKATEIGRLGTSDAVADLAILATDAIVADMAILATDAIVADMAILGTDAIVADMAILGTDAVVADMAILGSNDVVADMNLLGTSTVVGNMNLLGTSAVVTDMGILATTDVVADMAILATNDVVADMNVLGTSANVTAMNLLGTSANVTNMDTCADNLVGINSFAARYRVASSDPSSDLDEGDLAYNTNSNALKYYNGSAWITIVAGSLTAVVQDGSPQLGGNLDVQTNSIVSTSNRNIAITPNGSGKVVIDGLSHPVADGSNGQALVTNGSGVLSFATASSAEVYGFEKYYKTSTLVKTVTVVSVGGANKYFIDGVQQDTLDLYEGNTYIFNYPSAHPFKFSTTSNGSHAGGSEYTTGVTHNSSSQVTIVVAANAPTLYYYCSSHSAMGGTANTPTPGLNDMRYITTNKGADNITESQYANFNDVLFSASGFVFSINTNGNLISTI